MWWHTRRNQISSLRKRTNPFKLAGASVQSTTGSRGVRISGSNAGYTMFWGSVKSTGYPLHSPVSPSLPVPCVTVCHHVSTGLYPKVHWNYPSLHQQEFQYYVVWLLGAGGSCYWTLSTVIAHYCGLKYISLQTCLPTNSSILAALPSFVFVATLMR